MIDQTRKIASLEAEINYLTGEIRRLHVRVSQLLLAINCIRDETDKVIDGDWE